MGWLVSLYGDRLLFGAPPRDAEDMEFLGEEGKKVTHYVVMRPETPYYIEQSDVPVTGLVVPSDLSSRSEAKQIEWYMSTAEKVALLLKEDPDETLYVCNVTGHDEEATVAFLAWALVDPAHCPRNLGEWLAAADHSLVLDNEDSRRMTQGAVDRILNTNGRTIKSYFKKTK